MLYRQITNLTANENFLEQFLKERKISDLDRYLNTTREELYDFMLLDNIIQGANCLLKHIEQNGKIFLQPDADCDGICSAAIMYLYIKHINPNIEIRWRMHEGKQHGIILDTIPDDTTLVIAPDASSNDYEIHTELKKRGVDVLVIDHHIANEGYSKDAIVINNQLSQNYPNKDLCGGAMVYKFCCCLDQLRNDNFAESLIDLASISLIGDMMELCDLETRYIVKEGLNHITNIGLMSLFEKQSYSMGGKITPTSVAFYIVPLINALIRVGSQSEKEALFKAFINPLEVLPSTKRGHKPGDTETACAQAARICVNAKSRQDRTKQKILDTLDFEIQKQGLDENKIIFVEVNGDEEFDTTLTGLVAMGIASKYKKPTCVVRENSDGYLRGSARGLSNCPITDFRQFLLDSNLFEYATGHAKAFGISIHKDKKDNLIKYANEKLKDIDFYENVYDVDLIVNAENPNLSQIICELGKLSEIWGQGEPEPLIAIEGLELDKNLIKTIGSDGSTLKFEINGVTYIKFKDTQAVEEFSKHLTMNVTVLGKANLNNWLGEITPQILIEDYEIKDTSYDF